MTWAYSIYMNHKFCVVLPGVEPRLFSAKVRRVAITLQDNRLIAVQR